MRRATERGREVLQRVRGQAGEAEVPELPGGSRTRREILQRVRDEDRRRWLTGRVSFPTLREERLLIARPLMAGIVSGRFNGVPSGTIEVSVVPDGTPLHGVCLRPGHQWPGYCQNAPSGLIRRKLHSWLIHYCPACRLSCEGARAARQNVGSYLTHDAMLWSFSGDTTPTSDEENILTC
jgi:hypothetical protein